VFGLRGFEVGEKWTYIETKEGHNGFRVVVKGI